MALENHTLLRDGNTPLRGSSPQPRSGQKPHTLTLTRDVVEGIEPRIIHQQRGISLLIAGPNTRTVPWMGGIIATLTDAERHDLPFW